MSPHAIVVSNTFFEEGRSSFPLPQNAAVADCCLRRLGSGLLSPRTLRLLACAPRGLPRRKRVHNPIKQQPRCQEVYNSSLRQPPRQPCPSWNQRSQRTCEGVVHSRIPLPCATHVSICRDVWFIVFGQCMDFSKPCHNVAMSRPYDSQESSRGTPECSQRYQMTELHASDTQPKTKVILAASSTSTRD